MTRRRIPGRSQAVPAVRPESSRGGILPLGAALLAVVLAAACSQPAPTPAKPAAGSASTTGASATASAANAPSALPGPAPAPLPSSAAAPASARSAAPAIVVPDGAIYVCVTGSAPETRQAAIEYPPKVDSLCRKHPEMGPCQYERELCRKGGGRVYAAGGVEITAQTEAEYNRKVMRVRFQAN